jgi:hypothetical protein
VKCRVWGVRCRVWANLRFEVYGLRLRGHILRFGIKGVKGLRGQGLGCRVQDLGFRVYGLRFRMV